MAQVWDLTLGLVEPYAVELSPWTQPVHSSAEGQPLFPKPVALPGVVVSQGQDLGLQILTLHRKSHMIYSEMNIQGGPKKLVTLLRASLSTSEGRECVPKE